MSLPDFDAIAGRQTVAEFVNEYGRAEKDIRTGFALVKRGLEALGDTSLYVNHYVDFEDIDEVATMLRRKAWANIVDRLQMRRAMSVKAWDEFEKSMKTGEDSKRSSLRNSYFQEGECMDPSHVVAINEVSAEVYKIAADHGFHPDAFTEATDLGRLAKFCANLHGEISELWEAARKGTLSKSCDKDGCPLTCAEEELADIIIRAMDTAIALDIDLGMAICTKSLYNKTRPHMHGKLA